MRVRIIGSEYPGQSRLCPVPEDYILLLPSYCLSRKQVQLRKLYKLYGTTNCIFGARTNCYQGIVPLFMVKSATSVLGMIVEPEICGNGRQSKNSGSTYVSLSINIYSRTGNGKTFSQSQTFRGYCPFCFASHIYICT